MGGGVGVGAGSLTGNDLKSPSHASRGAKIKPSIPLSSRTYSQLPTAERPRTVTFASTRMKVSSSELVSGAMKIEEERRAVARSGAAGKEEDVSVARTVGVAGVVADGVAVGSAVGVAVIVGDGVRVDVAGLASDTGIAVVVGSPLFPRKMKK